MNILESIILGLVQGITEFLPISSSGHLILIRHFFDITTQNSLAFDVFLNTATLFAVIYCFWGEIRAVFRDLESEGFSARSKNLIYAIILGTIPAGLLGFFYSDYIENTFRGSATVSLALIVGSVIMFLADKIRHNQGGLSPIKGFIVGLFQALALIPGISRSGASISGGIFVGLSREEAIKFSFLLLIPVSLGALLKVVLDLTPSDMSNFLNLSHILAFIAAMVSGIWAVRFLTKYLVKNSFTPFIIYRLLLAGVILLFL